MIICPLQYQLLIFEAFLSELFFLEPRELLEFDVQHPVSEPLYHSVFEHSLHTRVLPTYYYVWLSTLRCIDTVGLSLFHS